MANIKISEYSELTGVADSDLIEIVDVSDTSMASSGTNKKITKANLVSDIYRKTEADAQFVENSQIDTDGTLAANSDAKIPSQKAIKTYVDSGNQLSLGGWTPANETWTYSSSDGATGVFNVASDVTGKYSVGMRTKYTQSQSITAYWSMDSASTDAIGGFNGTDTAMSYTAGKFGNAATFNGTTSKIVITDNAALKPTGEFTIGCWFKTSNNGATKVLYQSRSINTNVAGIALQITSGNFLSINIGNNTDINGISTAGQTTVTDGNWHYCVVSYRNNYVQLYLDGKLESSNYAITPVYTATNYVRIGCGNSTGTDVNFMNGQIDDLFIINGYALDEATIKAKYVAGTAQGIGNITVQKYGLITNVGAYSGGNTLITIWGGTDYSTTNATISSPYYSVQKVPFGFDLRQFKWSVEVSLVTSFSQNSPVQNTWYNALVITVPVGSWDLSYNSPIYVNVASGSSTRVSSTLSTANNTESDILMTGDVGTAGAIGSIDSWSLVYRNRNITISSKTQYYLNIRTRLAGMTIIGCSSTTDPTIIRAISSYL